MNRDIMNMVNLCLNAINCVILFVLMLLTVKKLENSSKRNNFLVLLLMAFFFNLFDCSSWAFEGNDAAWKIPALHSTTFMYYLVTPFLFIAFMKFTRTILKEKYLKNPYYIICMASCIAIIGEAFADCFPGFAYTLSADNYYGRSDFYSLHIITVFAFYFSCIMYVISNRKQMDKKTFLTILSFPSLPTVSFIPQLLFYGLATVNIGLVISMILMYVNLKNEFELGTGKKVFFTSEYFHKKDKLSFAEKVRRFVCSYGFSDTAISSIRSELQDNEKYNLKIVTGATGILTALCFVLSFTVRVFQPQRFIYLGTTILCILLALLFHKSTKYKGLSVSLGYLFFILMFAVNMYKSFAITPEQAPMMFACVLFIAPSIFCDQPYVICILVYSATFIYMDLARVYKPHEQAVSDSIYLFGLATLGIVIGYSMSKTKITSIYLSKNLDNEVAAKTKQLSAMSKEIVTTLASSIESKDEYTNGHSERVANYAVMVASKIGWSEEKCDELWMEAILHDVGKIGVPDSILKKTEQLTDEEFKVIQSHTTVGSRILENLASFPKAKEAAKYHHERVNGKGYPEGLSGLDIPEAARIVAIADAYDAMTTSRCYRPALADEVVMKELMEGRGSQFDPVLLDIFLQIIREHGGSLLEDRKAAEE